MKHFYQGFLFLTCYIVFTVVWWAAGGTDAEGHHYIYPVLDYDQPVEAALLILLTIFVVLPSLHSLLWLYVRGLNQRFGRKYQDVQHLHVRTEKENLLT